MEDEADNVVLRSARPTDAPELAALIRMAFAIQPIALDPPPSALGVTAGGIAAHLASHGATAAEVGGRLVGAALWQVAEDSLAISRLAVAPAWRRRGIARRLLAEAEMVARAAGLVRLTLGTRLALVGNCRLFAARGFVEGATHAHPGYRAPTWVEMEKRLAP